MRKEFQSRSDHLCGVDNAAIVDDDKRMIQSRLREYLYTMGTKLPTLAKKTGISLTTLEYYRQGRSTPGMTNLRLLVEGTGISADYWIGTDRR